MTLYGVVGAGGFGREVMPLVRDLLASTNDTAEAVFVVEDRFAQSTSRAINGYRVLSMSEFLHSDQERVFTLAIGNSLIRQRIAEEIPSEIRPFQVVSRSALNYEANQIGVGAIFCGFTHVTSNAVVGKFFHCNIYSYVAHDCQIGDYVTFAPGVKCNGHVVVEDHAYVGTGAIIRDATERPIVIGKGAVVGAGAVVTKSVPPGMVVVGNPAKVMQARV